METAWLKPSANATQCRHLARIIYILICRRHYTYFFNCIKIGIATVVYNGTTINTDK